MPQTRSQAASTKPKTRSKRVSGKEAQSKDKKVTAKATVKKASKKGPPTHKRPKKAGVKTTEREDKKVTAKATVKKASKKRPPTHKGPKKAGVKMTEKSLWSFIKEGLVTKTFRAVDVFVVDLSDGTRDPRPVERDLILAWAMDRKYDTELLQVVSGVPVHFGPTCEEDPYDKAPIHLSAYFLDTQFPSISSDDMDEVGAR